MSRVVIESRSELRKARYNHLRNLGFSSKDAAKYRDQSAIHITEYTETETQRITEKKSNVRDDREREILRRVRRARRKNAPPSISPRLKPVGERITDFSNWTRDGFPAEAMRYIEAENADKGLDPADSYGFRRFYWRYVEGKAQSELADFADRGDSEIRA